MSVHTPFDSFTTASTARPHPVVLRFAGMFPADLAGFALHGERAGGDLDHVDRGRSAQNRILIGGAGWADLLRKEVEATMHCNLAEELEALERRKRVKEHADRLLQGLADPWKSSKKGPLREVILTANREWFNETNDLDVLIGGPSREQRFEDCALDWLKKNFGEAVVFARADHDEMAYQIHAVIAPWHEKTSARRGKQRLLQPTAYPLLQSYEKAQDDVGEHFGVIGLVRGERTAAARREAIAERRTAIQEGVACEDLPDIPEERRHVPTPEWWAEQTRHLQAEARKLEKEKAQLAAQRAEAAKVAEAAQIALLEAEQRQVSVDWVAGCMSVGPFKEYYAALDLVRERFPNESILACRRCSDYHFVLAYRRALLVAAAPPNPPPPPTAPAHCG